MSWLVILILILLGLGLLLNMIFSAISAAQIYRSDCSHDSEMKKAYDKNLWTAIISGLGLIGVIAALAVYIYSSRREIKEEALKLLGGKPQRAVGPLPGRYAPRQRMGPDGNWQKVMMGRDTVEMSTTPQLFATTGVPASLPKKAPAPRPSAPRPAPKKSGEPSGVWFKIAGEAPGAC